MTEQGDSKTREWPVIESPKHERWFDMVSGDRHCVAVLRLAEDGTLTVGVWNPDGKPSLGERTIVRYSTVRAEVI